MPIQEQPFKNVHNLKIANFFHGLCLPVYSMLLHDPSAIKLLVNCGHLIDKNPLSRGAFVGKVDNTEGFLKIVSNFLIVLLKKHRQV